MTEEERLACRQISQAARGRPAVCFVASGAYQSGVSAGGLAASSYRLSATARNLANLNTEGYQAIHVSTTTGGRADSVSFDPTPGPIDADGVEGSNVDLARESINLLREKHQYAMNAKVLKLGDELMGTLLDVMG